NGRSLPRLLARTSFQNHQKPRRSNPRRWALSRAIGANHPKHRMYMRCSVFAIARALKSRPMLVRLTKTFHFEAAHDLPTSPPDHKCRRLHGHSFRFDVIVEGEVDPARGYLIDYGDIKRAAEPLVKRLDHYYLNEIEGLGNPTSENLARWIWDHLQ